MIEQAQAALAAVLNEYSDSPVLYLASGGSAFELINSWRHSLPKNLTLGVIDERYGVEPNASNWRQLAATELANRAISLGAEVLNGLPRASESLERAADRYDALLKSWRSSNPKGKIVSTLGVGLDGHIAGIMPFPEDEVSFERTFIETDRWVVGYDAVGKNPYRYRITVTGAFLMTQVDSAIVFAPQADKEAVVKRALSGEYSLAQFPAGLIRQLKNAELFTVVQG